jgi:mannose-1-phosphate guanylyltransferase/mannose-6-phosphate isomerase
MIFPVILSGGSGSRLWPLSREFYPKQLLRLTGDRTLLQETALRTHGLPGAQAPLLVCNEEHRFLVAEQIRELALRPQEILLEPFGRNTAPALTLAALALQERAPTGLMLVMAADHVIADVPAFQRAVRIGIELAGNGALVTFGIVPILPETGYGYIRRGDDFRVRQFVEKPDRDTAQRYLEQGDYLWNSGIFLMTVESWLNEIGRHRPDILDACRVARANGTRDADFYRVETKAFERCPSDSIDYAVMEKTERANVVPLDAGWSDVGAWSSLWHISQRDAEGNVSQGDVLTHATRNTLAIAQHRLVATVGVSDMIVVETPDAVLVAHKDRAQDVREIVERLKREKRTEHQIHRRVYRPWGSYEGVDSGDRFQVKHLTIKPRSSLSLQLHLHRAEHWIVVRGTARVTCGEKTFELSENQSTYIPVGTKHRLENPGDTALEIIEVQSGDYLGEDDIQRFDDLYNRHAVKIEKS